MDFESIKFIYQLLVNYAIWGATLAAIVILGYLYLRSPKRLNRRKRGGNTAIVRGSNNVTIQQSGNDE